MLLAIDTATRQMSIALHDGQAVPYEATWHTANNHTIELAPAIQRALNQLALTPGDLQGVAVAQGPGSFTGLRIGMSMAKGLTLAQDIPLVAVPTLHIVAAGIPPLDGSLVAVLQAGRGRVCAQRFDWNGQQWQPADQAVITPWDDLLGSLDPSAHIAGEINEQGRAALRASRHRTVPGARALRRAGILAEIAWNRIHAGQTDDPATITPVYLHQPGVSHP